MLIYLFCYYLHVSVRHSIGFLRFGCLACLRSAAILVLCAFDVAVAGIASDVPYLCALLPGSMSKMVGVGTLSTYGLTECDDTLCTSVYCCLPVSSQILLVLYLTGLQLLELLPLSVCL